MINKLLTDLLNSSRPVIITGAGISVASGIAPFRGKHDAVWSQDVMEMGTYRMFQSNPVAQWQWYLKRLVHSKDAKPNAAHYAITELQKQKPNLSIVTQNVDGLHIKADTKNVFEVHGCARKVRCDNYYCKNGGFKGSITWDDDLFAPFIANPSEETLPKCSCGALIRPHVLWFDEWYHSHYDYQYENTIRFLEAADLMIFVGTSFSVGITEAALETAKYNKTKIWVIDPVEPPEGNWIQGKAEEILPEVLRLL